MRLGNFWDGKRRTTRKDADYGTIVDKRTRSYRNFHLLFSLTCQRNEILVLHLFWRILPLDRSTRIMFRKTANIFLQEFVFIFKRCIWTADRDQIEPFPWVEWSRLICDVFDLGYDEFGGIWWFWTFQCSYFVGNGTIVTGAHRRSMLINDSVPTIFLPAKSFNCILKLCSM